MSTNDLVVTPETLNQVLTAIELDLRRIATSYLGNETSPKGILGDEPWRRCSERLSKEQGIAAEAARLDELLPYVDFGDLYQLLNTHNLSLPTTASRAVREATPHLAKLVSVRNRVAHHRPLLYDDCTVTKETALYLCQSSEDLWSGLKEALSGLAHTVTAQFRTRLNNLPVPDYEETGYIGRKQQIADLKRSILTGPYPVITVFGDGGVGKSALALKVAYDILASEDCPFEAIIWTSSKTQQLTPHEIARVKDAIADSLGMFNHISGFLGAQDARDPVQEVLAYLAEFPILLIMDNLETVLDDLIRRFLANLPRGSKVLINPMCEFL